MVLMHPGLTKLSPAIFVRRVLLEFQVRSHPEGILLLHGLPIDPGLYQVPTPAHAQRLDQKVTFVSEWCLAMIGSRLGHLVSYIQKKNGDLLCIDNRRTVRGRSYFTPRYDGFDR